jgi:hypothetical protein
MRHSAFVIAGFVVAACSSHHDNPGPADAAPSTSIVFGVTSEDMGGAIGSLHVTSTVDGAQASDETIDVIKNPKWFPKEVKVSPAAGKQDGVAELHIDGFLSESGSSGAPPILTRLAKASFVANQSLLVRVLLQTQCIEALPGGPPGGPTCTAPATCVAGSCVDETQASTPVPYDPGWATNTPDACKPANAGPPVVQIGTGQTDFLPLTDGQTLQLEQGPQGGHHIWIAARMHNLRQSGSTTTITATQPGGSASVSPTAFVFTFDTDEGGFCKLYGLRFQVDAGGGDYHAFLGQPLDVTVTIKDSTGASGSATAHISLAPTILCPNGTSATSC